MSSPTSRAIRCPKCNAPSIVAQTFTSKSGKAKTRIHRCERGHRFQTYQACFDDGDLTCLRDRGFSFPLDKSRLACE